MLGRLNAGEQLNQKWMPVLFGQQENVLLAEQRVHLVPGEHIFLLQRLNCIIAVRGVVLGEQHFAKVAWQERERGIRMRQLEDNGILTR